MSKRYSYLNQLNLNDIARAFGNGVQFKGIPTIKLISKTLIKARRKHPVFARSKAEALNAVTAEYFELVQAVTKGEGPRREREEAAHAVATLIRFIMKEWLDYEEEAGAEKKD